MIQLTFKLTKEDYLAYQMYQSSISRHLRGRRIRAQYIYPVAFLLLAAFGYSRGLIGTCAAFVVIAAVWYLVFAIFQKSFYIRHYKKFIDEKIQPSMTDEVIVKFEDDHIFGSDIDSESKVKYTAISRVVQLPDYYFIFIGEGQAIILPIIRLNKEQLISAINYLKNTKKIPLLDERDWVWK